MQRRGLGIGLGKGYYNLVPKDPYIHSLSAKGIKTKIKYYTLSDSFFDKKQLKKGQKVELEHTNSKKIAKAIAKAHLLENPDYYKKYNPRKKTKEYLVNAKGEKEYDYQIYLGELPKKEIKKKEYPYTKREKKVALATIGGAGAGFVVGGLLGGLGGMMIGVPLGTFTGNIIAEKSIPKSGRKPKYKVSYLKRLFNTREDLLRERENINKIERVRKKSEQNLLKSTI